MPLTDSDRRTAAIDAYNRAWDLLDLGDSRSTEQDDELIDAAHASRYLWRTVGGPEQAAIGEWMISRAYAVTGHGESAVRHASRADAIVEAHPDLPHWLRASVSEGMARALLAAGDATQGALWRDRAVTECAAIPDPDDRALIEEQVASLG